MDRISLLPEELILEILSSVSTKVAVTTSLLSKRWCHLWKHVPRLWYRAPSDYQIASRFVSTFLSLNKAHVLESIHLSLPPKASPEDIETWTSIAISRGVRHLIYSLASAKNSLRFPTSLYTCETLVKLVLLSAVIVDVPLKICFPSLKVLFLIEVDFVSDEIVCRFLSGCPVLKQLRVIRHGNDRVKTFTIAVPSLEYLTILEPKCLGDVPRDDVGFAIKAPSLKSLIIFNKFSWVCSSVKMPYLVKASIKLPHGAHSNKFRACLTSAKHLSLCLQPPLDPSHIGGVFDQLVSLNLCTCSLNLCGLILRHTPKLRVVRFVLYQAGLSPNLTGTIQKCSFGDGLAQWEQPNPVPQCLIKSLETVVWIDYKGTQSEKEMVLYLLKNSRQLKKVSIRSLASTNLNEKHKMLLELASAQRISSECRLLFT